VKRPEPLTRAPGPTAATPAVPKVSWASAPAASAIATIAGPLPVFETTNDSWALVPTPTSPKLSDGGLIVMRAPRVVAVTGKVTVGRPGMLVVAVNVVVSGAPAIAPAGAEAETVKVVEVPTTIVTSAGTTVNAGSADVSAIVTSVAPSLVTVKVALVEPPQSTGPRSTARGSATGPLPWLSDTGPSEMPASMMALGGSLQAAAAARTKHR
jgi:hypothetical protein